jgi:hypothetical protein
VHVDRDHLRAALILVAAMVVVFVFAVLNRIYD